MTTISICLAGQGTGRAKCVSKVLFCLSVLTFLGLLQAQSRPETLRFSNQSGNIDGQAPLADLGYIQGLIAGDVFADADADNPIFIRIQLTQGVRLAETLVDIDLPAEQRVHQPIYLPLVLSGRVNDLSIGAAPDTLAIVRWVAGEDQIWLSISQTSSNWIQLDETLTFAPSEALAVYFWLGSSAPATWAHLAPLYVAGAANLPAATTNPGQPDQAHAVSTLLCGDLFTSALVENGPLARQATFFATTFFQASEGVTSAASPAAIDVGRNLFPEDDTPPLSLQRHLARPSNCALDATLLMRPTVPICDSRLQEATSRIRLSATCNAGSEGLQRVRIRFLDQSVGFNIARDPNNQPLSAEHLTGVTDSFLLAPDALAGNGITQAWCHAADIHEFDQGALSESANILIDGALLSDIELQMTNVFLGAPDETAATPQISVFAPGQISEPSFIAPFEDQGQASDCGRQNSLSANLRFEPLFEAVPCTVVQFEDATLSAAILADYDSDQNGWLSFEEAAFITALDVSAMGIVSLQGLQHLTELRSLNAADNLLTEAALPELDTLTRLDLRNNQLEGVTVLTNYDRLLSEAGAYLDLRGNRLRDNAATCTALDFLAQRFEDIDTEMLVNAQGNGTFYGQVSEWPAQSRSDVLRLVAVINQMGTPQAPYDICTDAAKGGRQ